MSTKRGQKSGSETAVSNGKAQVKAPSPANAWARPLQPKPTPGPPPGLGLVPGSGTRAGASSSPSTVLGKGSGANGSSIATIHRERLLHLSLTLVGQRVLLSQSNGTVLEGIFHTFTPFSGLTAEMKNKYVLNAVKVIKLPDPAAPGGGPEGNTIRDGSTVIIPVEKVMCVHAKNINLQRAANGATTLSPQIQASSDVVTDSQISGSRGGRNRDLVAAGSAWTVGGSNSRADALAGALEERAGGSSRKGFGTARTGLQGNIGEWDQFKANQELFNVNATYDENLYTTALDKSQLDAKKIAEAERIAKEIENTTSTNLHVAEERGHVLETDYDEEDRYSGVLTKEGKVRHTAIPKEKDSAREIGPSEPKPTAPVPPPTKMNYAAAAAKADAGKNIAPPGFTPSKPDAQPTPTPKSSTNTSVSAAVGTTEVSATVAKGTLDEEKLNQKQCSVSPQKSAEGGETLPENDAKHPDNEEREKGSVECADERMDPQAVADPDTNADVPLADGAATKDDPSSEKQYETKGERSEELKKTGAKEVAKTSKLNANAKAFTFNPSAKSFTPSFGGNNNFTAAAAAADTQHQHAPQAPDTNASMQMHPHPMQPPHYMHAPMGQPGMMPIMTPQFPGMRYQHQYPGMEQPVQQLQSHQPQHAQPPSVNGSSQGQNTASNSVPPAEDESSQSQPQGQEGDTVQQPAPQTQRQQPQQSPQQPAQQQQQPPQQQPPQPPPQQQPPQPPQQPQIPMPYNVPPPGAYFAGGGGGMAMHPRGPGYPPQFAGGPQQIPVGPGGAPYRHMYPMQPGAIPPNMQFRGPGGPYFPGPNTPMPYPPGGYVGHGMIEENDGGFRGRGRGPGGRGRGRRGGRGRGPGRGGYQSYGSSNGGRHSQHHHQQHNQQHHHQQQHNQQQNQVAPADPPDTAGTAPAQDPSEGTKAAETGNDE